MSDQETTLDIKFISHKTFKPSDRPEPDNYYMSFCMDLFDKVNNVVSTNIEGGGNGGQGWWTCMVCR